MTRRQQLLLDVENFFRQQGLSLSGRYLLAVSGGADSTALLLVMHDLRARFGTQLRVLSFDHGLRESAAAEAESVRSLSEALGVPAQIQKLPVQEHAEAQGLGIEEAARDLRRSALEAAAKRWEAEADENSTASPNPPEDEPVQNQDPHPVYILTGHHRGDNAETLLFHLCRGSSLAGLSGIRPVSGRFVRPLLAHSHEELCGMLQEEGIAWCEDESNGSFDYTRNRIRHHILPLLEEYVHPGAEMNLARAAEHIAAAESLLAAETERCFAQIVSRGEGGVRILALPALTEAPSYYRSRILYEALAEAAGGRKDLTAHHVELLEGLMADPENGSLDLPGCAAVKSYDRLLLARNRDTALAWLAENDGERGSFLPREAEDYRTEIAYIGEGAPADSRYTKSFDYDKISANFMGSPEFRTPQPGDIITLPGGHHKSVKRALMEARVPKGLRDKAVLPYVGREALWIPGIRLSAAFPVTETTQRVIRIHVNAREG